MLKIALFDAKPYDEPAFRRFAADAGMDIRFYETRLGPDTVSLAEGFDGVIPFVNDTIDARVAEALAGYGVKVIAMRCAGYNNVDLKAVRGRLAVYRVPAYSPHAVAEHAMAMLLTIVRRTHKTQITADEGNKIRSFTFRIGTLIHKQCHFRR